MSIIWVIACLLVAFIVGVIVGYLSPDKPAPKKVNETVDKPQTDYEFLVVRFLEDSGWQRYARLMDTVYYTLGKGKPCNLVEAMMIESGRRIERRDSSKH